MRRIYRLRASVMQALDGEGRRGRHAHRRRRRRRRDHRRHAWRRQGRAARRARRRRRHDRRDRRDRRRPAGRHDPADPASISRCRSRASDDRSPGLQARGSADLTASAKAKASPPKLRAKAEVHRSDRRLLRQPALPVHTPDDLAETAARIERVGGVLIRRRGLVQRRRAGRGRAPA